MERRRMIRDAVEREALLGLWAIPGIGPVSLEKIEIAVGGSIRAVADVPVREWLHRVKLPDTPTEWLSSVTTLRELAAGVRASAEKRRMRIDFVGDEGYPKKLLEIADPPPMLFSFGRIGRERRRVGVVGSRHPENGTKDRVARFPLELAEAGICIVSGAAEGCDTVAHDAALSVGGETWAFVASSLDELDPKQADNATRILEGGGRVLTEYPPRVRAKKDQFPRRNRLISGVSHAVLLLRAAKESGTLHTARHAREQGRPVFILPSDPWNECNAGALHLLRRGEARICTSARDILDVLGVVPERQAPAAPPGRTVSELPLSAAARRAFAILDPGVRVFEELQVRSQLDADELVSALTELELSGLAVQHPGRIYEKV